MKYLVLYIILIFGIYISLKYYCYSDQKNILDTKTSILDSKSSSIENNSSSIEEFSPLTSLYVQKNPNINFSYIEKNLHDDYEYMYQFPETVSKKNIKENFDEIPSSQIHSHMRQMSPNLSVDNTNQIKWKTFGTDISSDYVKQKKSQFREITSPNISIEKYNGENSSKFLKRQQHFRKDMDIITKEDRQEISLSNLITPRIIETYDSVSGISKPKAFGLALKKQFKSVNKLSKTFRSIRFKSDIQLPKQFNGPEIWKDYLTPINDQGICGNCWAHASSAVLADRFAILSLGKIKFVPSPYEMTICSSDFQNVDIQKVWKNEEELQKMDKRMHQDRSCNGNNLYDTATSIFIDGVTELSCFPDKFKTSTGKDVNVGKTENVDNFPYCYSVTGLELDTCVDRITPMRKYRCKTAYVCSKENDDITLKERKLMYDIYKYGPVIVGFMMFPDFVYDYNGKTIYTHSDKSGGDLGGHAVRVVGWGEETVNGELIKYWWIANSWGKDWGINGYFRMKRCMPEIQLEDNVMSILPDFPGMIIEDPSLEAVETEKDIEIQNFTGHFLDKKTGYYNTSIEKLKNCQIRGKMFPYINDSFLKYLPKYKEFFAAKVSDHISSNKINEISYNNDIPTYFCSQDYTPIPETTPDNTSVSPSTESSAQNIRNTQTQNQEQNSENKEQNNETNFHKNVCKVINYKYFDFIYIFITGIIGVGIYFISSENTSNITSSSTVSKKPILIDKNSTTIAELNIIQSPQLNTSTISPPITPLIPLSPPPSPPPPPSP